MRADKCSANCLFLSGALRLGPVLFLPMVPSFLVEPGSLSNFGLSRSLNFIALVRERGHDPDTTTEPTNTRHIQETPTEKSRGEIQTPTEIQTEIQRKSRHPGRKSRHPRTRRSDQSASASTFPLRASRRSERARIEPTVVSLRSLDVGSGMVRPVETASGGGSSVRGGNTLRVEA
jgi:hypothetical protein